jgi:hypothetical protein
MAEPYKFEYELEYEKYLASLSGIPFQQEVSRLLGKFIDGFQTVPPYPQGDGSLDGISHFGEQAYCCYGLEHDEFKAPPQRVKAIIKKFKNDLLKLFELKGKELKHSENKELATILPKGAKIKHITLICNWFNSHQVLGPILTAVKEYREASQCRYVEKTVIVVVAGPKELATRYAVDEQTIARLRHRTLVQNVEKKAKEKTLAGTEKFDKKMAMLRQILPGKDEAIDEVEEDFRYGWRLALTFEEELNATLPDQHRSFEADRRRIRADVSTMMLGAKEPWSELPKTKQLARDVLEKDFGALFGTLLIDVSSGEIARLIGECRIRWEAPANDKG